MRAQEFLIERAERARDAIENIVSMGDADDYFVRFTDIDKLGYSAKQDFGRTPDIGSADYDPDALPRKTGRPALWFYPAKYYLQNQNLFASNKPYTWLVKKRPNAYLQPTAKATHPSAPEGMTRAGLMHRESGVPVAIFFRPEFDVVDRWHETQRVDELQFLGSECTKDCSGHRAGYEWSKARGGIDAASPWSPSFNKGAALAKAGK